LAGVVTVVPQEQDQDADDQEGCAKRLADAPQRGEVAVVGGVPAAYRGVESKELGDGDADGRKGETRPEPREKGPF